MNPKDYIKVTPRGAKEAVIIPASNKDFYLATGALVEKPTEEEIYAACPYLKPKEPIMTPEVKAMEEVLADLRAENNNLRKEIEKKRIEVEKLKKAQKLAESAPDETTAKKSKK